MQQNTQWHQRVTFAQTELYQITGNPRFFGCQEQTARHQRSCKATSGAAAPWGALSRRGVGFGAELGPFLCCISAPTGQLRGPAQTRPEFVKGRKKRLQRHRRPSGARIRGSLTAVSDSELQSQCAVNQQHRSSDIIQGFACYDAGQLD